LNDAASAMRGMYVLVPATKMSVFRQNGFSGYNRFRGLLVRLWRDCADVISSGIWKDGRDEDVSARWPRMDSGR